MCAHNQLVCLLNKRQTVGLRLRDEHARATFPRTCISHREWFKPLGEPDYLECAATVLNFGVKKERVQNINVPLGQSDSYTIRYTWTWTWQQDKTRFPRTVVQYWTERKLYGAFTGYDLVLSLGSTPFIYIWVYPPSVSHFYLTLRWKTCPYNLRRGPVNFVISSLRFLLVPVATDS